MDSRLLTLPNKAEKGNHMPQENPAVAIQLYFPTSSRPSMQAVSFDPFLPIQSPQPFLPYFSNITLTYFSLPINHVSTALYPLNQSPLLFKRGKTLNQEILFFFLLYFILDFLRRARYY